MSVAEFFRDPDINNVPGSVVNDKVLDIQTDPAHDHVQAGGGITGGLKAVNGLNVQWF